MALGQYLDVSHQHLGKKSRHTKVVFSTGLCKLDFNCGFAQCDLQQTYKFFVLAGEYLKISIGTTYQPRNVLDLRPSITGS
jgi:hypothetical protein